MHPGARDAASASAAMIANLYCGPDCCLPRTDIYNAVLRLILVAMERSQEMQQSISLEPSVN
jgi:hypothetical protein